MNRTVALGVAAALLVASFSGFVVAQETDDGSGPGAPGAQFAGVVGSQAAEVDAAVESRALETRLSGAPNETAKARIVAEQHARNRERLAELRERAETLRERHEAGNISESQFDARMVRVVVEMRTIQTLSNRSEAAAMEVPENVREQVGVDVDEIQAVASEADDASDLPEADTGRRSERNFGDGLREPDADERANASPNRSTPPSTSSTATNTEETPAADLANGTPTSNATNATPTSNLTNGTPTANATNGTPGTDAADGTPTSNLTNATPAVDVTEETPGVDATEETPETALGNATPGTDSTDGTPGVTNGSEESFDVNDSSAANESPGETATDEQSPGLANASANGTSGQSTTSTTESPTDAPEVDSPTASTESSTSPTESIEADVELDASGENSSEETETGAEDSPGLEAGVEANGTGASVGNATNGSGAVDVGVGG